MRTTAFRFCLLLLVGCSAQRQSAPTANDQNETVPDSEYILGEWEIVDAMRDGAEYPIEVGSTTMFNGQSAIVRTADGIETQYASNLTKRKHLSTLTGH